MTHTGLFLRTVCLASLLFAGAAAMAQDSPEFKDGYAQGYKDGFDAGYRKGMSEQRNASAAEQRSAIEAASKGFPIAITAATYGPDSGPRCDATRYVRKEANGRRSASVTITNDMCGDPAPGKRKSIEITYLCGSVPKTATAYEHRSAYLSCD